MSITTDRLKQLKAANLFRYHAGEQIRFGWFKSLIQNLLPTDASLKILDAGAGEGRMALFVAKQYPRSCVVGMDANQQAVARCQKNGQARNLANLRFVSGDLTWPIQEGAFDLIYCVDVLEHICSDETVLKNFRRGLTPNGVLLVHVPLLAKQRHFKRFAELKNPDHVREGYAPDELCAKLKSVGLEPLSQTFSFGKWGAIAWELWMLSRRLVVTVLLLRPLLSVLSQLELRSVNRHGNGVWTVARRKPRSTDEDPADTQFLPAAAGRRPDRG